MAKYRLNAMINSVLDMNEVLYYHLPTTAIHMKPGVTYVHRRMMPRTKATHNIFEVTSATVSAFFIFGHS